MKYYVEYPIPIECNLRCSYCFHRMHWEHNARYPDDRRGDRCPFTFARYQAWRDKHLADGEEFLMELHGGEMSHPACQRVVLDIIDAADKEKFQLQTNGLGDADFYREIIKRKDKIDRIGLTYHRAMIGYDLKPTGKFCYNVSLLKSAGVDVYVKELLILEHKESILRNKDFWEHIGAEFRIQDFKGGGESEKYTAEDWALVHPEYYHRGSRCHCREGYKQIIIRGYDHFAGDVLACWQDHKRIGNIMEDWYEPYECVEIDATAPRGSRMVGGRDYRNDHLADVKIAERELYYYNHNQRRYWMLARLEKEKERLLGLIQENETANAQDRVLIDQTRKQAEDAMAAAQKRIAERTNVITMATGGIQMTDMYIELAKAPEAKAAESSIAEACLTAEERSAIKDVADAPRAQT